MEDLYCLSVRPYYYVHINVSGLHSKRHIILDITPPILPVSHMSTVPIVAAVGNERRTKVGQSDFLSRQNPLFELP